MGPAGVQLCTEWQTWSAPQPHTSTSRTVRFSMTCSVAAASIQHKCAAIPAAAACFGICCCCCAGSGACGPDCARAGMPSACSWCCCGAAAAAVCAAALRCSRACACTAARAAVARSQSYSCVAAAGCGAPGDQADARHLAAGTPPAACGTVTCTSMGAVCMHSISMIWVIRGVSRCNHGSCQARTLR